MFIKMRRDMSVVDGNMRLSAALGACDDVRKFRTEVVIIEDSGAKSPGIVYFDEKLNRLHIKDKDNGQEEKQEGA